MSRWELVGTICALAVASSTAAAQGVTATGATGDDAPGVQPEPERLEVGVTGLPGGDHVGYAESLPGGTVSTAFSAGYGRRSGLLASGHTMSRGAATAALAYSITDFLSIGFLLDGRYDKHTGTGFVDDGWVGEPRLHIRAGKASGSLAFGAELTVWTPGKDAPSIVPKATSVEARGLVSKRLGNGLRLAGNAGFRLDNSAESVDNAMDLSTPDQASLGVSQWNAAVVGVRAAYPAGRITLGFEGEVDIYVGGPAGKPSPSVMLGASASFALTPNLTAELFLASDIQDKPTATMVSAGAIPLIPYGPTIAGGLGIQARFGGPKKPGGGGILDVVKTTCDDPDPAKHPDDCPTTPPPPTLAVLTGQVTDDAGAPLAGAKVTITDCDGTATSVTTGADGSYRAENLKPCAVTIATEAPNRIAQSAKTTLVAGDNTAPPALLPPTVKPGAFVFAIRSFKTGKFVAAEVEINPGGQKVTAAADGSTQIEIAPGTYTLTITSQGLKTQVRQYVVTENNNVIVNVDLR